MSTTFIPFTVKIINFVNHGFFNVEYIPEDANCTPMFMQVDIDPASLPDSNAINQILSVCSPQDYWLKQKAVASVDTTHLVSMASTEIKVTTQPVPQSLGPVTSQTVSNVQGLTQDQVQELKTATLIQRVLSEMIGATV